MHEVRQQVKVFPLVFIKICRGMELKLHKFFISESDGMISQVHVRFQVLKAMI
jgi:hypothetical protein